MIDLKKIRVQSGTQSREAINENTVNEYAELIENGVELPPIVLFFDSTDYWIADGWHRYLACKKLGCLTIREEIIPGTQRDAQRYSLGANAEHGLPRTRADKVKAVTIALNDKEWARLSDREIASMCKVSHTFVAKLREKAPEKQTRKAEILEAPKHDRVATLPVSECPLTPEPIEIEDSYSELDAANDQIAHLQDLIAAGVSELSEDEKGATGNHINAMRDEIKSLKATLKAVTVARDSLMTENASMKKQIAMQRSEIDKLKKIIAAGGW